MARIGIITGIPIEAACVDLRQKAEHEIIIRSGVGYENAKKNAHYLINQKIDGLVSFGVAGGLSPSIESGMLVVPSEIRGRDQVIAVSGSWRQSLLSRFNEMVSFSAGPMAHADRVLTEAVDKQEMFWDTRTSACDMESFGVGEVAAIFDIPFLIVRAVSDPVDLSIPSWVPGLLDHQGCVKKLDFCCQLLAHPMDIVGLWHIARASNKAFKCLKTVSRLAGPGFGFPI